MFQQKFSNLYEFLSSSERKSMGYINCLVTNIL